MSRQKRVAMITDFTGFGRCSTAVDLPIISAMKIQCCILPTAVLSAHTGYPSYWLQDYTEYMAPYMDNWHDLNVRFDGIGIGYLGSQRQIEEVKRFFSLFRQENTLILLDPVMGDDGRLYSSYSKELCASMRELVPYANVITPNLTEACFLLGLDYETIDTSSEGLTRIVRALSDMGPERVVITGLHEGRDMSNFAYDRTAGGPPRRIAAERIGRQRAGTGDVFAAVLFAALINGMDFYAGVRKAVDFINRCLAFTEACETPVQDGLCFEEFLSEL